MDDYHTSVSCGMNTSAFCTMEDHIWLYYIRDVKVDPFGNRHDSLYAIKLCYLQRINRALELIRRNVITHLDYNHLLVILKLIAGYQFILEKTYNWPHDKEPNDPSVEHLYSHVHDLRLNYIVLNPAHTIFRDINNAYRYIEKGKAYFDRLWNEQETVNVPCTNFFAHQTLPDIRRLHPLLRFSDKKPAAKKTTAKKPAAKKTTKK